MTFSVAIYRSLSLISLWILTQATCCYGQVHEFDLENGIHVIVHPIAEASDVGVETIYQVGFLDEPKGMVQSAHLVEHLVCYAGGAGFEPKGAMKWLNEVGMANAETLADFTHYDYVAPAEELEKILQIESARIKQQQFDDGLIRREAKRVYQETDFVENAPATGMLKHGFMALIHAWKYQSQSALVRGGLEEIDRNHLVGFYKDHYRPEKLTLVISGKTTLEEAKELVGRHLGTIPRGNMKRTKIDWTQVPKNSRIQWDAKHSAICVSWNPPADQQQRLLLSILGLEIFQRASQNPELKETCHLVATSNPLWKVGELPFFIYALKREDSDLDEVANQLRQFVEDELATVTKKGPMLARSLANQYEMQCNPASWKRMQQTSKIFAAQRGAPQNPIQQVILQDAFARGLSRQFLGDDPESTLSYLKSVTDEDFQIAIKACVREVNRRVVQIVPETK